MDVELTRGQARFMQKLRLYDPVELNPRGRLKEASGWRLIYTTKTVHSHTRHYTLTHTHTHRYEEGECTAPTSTFSRSRKSQLDVRTAVHPPNYSSAGKELSHERKTESRERRKERKETEMLIEEKE